jgi:hypothetical protein
MNTLLHTAITAVLNFIQTDPAGYQYLTCLSAGVIGVLAITLYCARTKRILKMLQGPVPTLSQRAELQEFADRRANLRYKADNAGIWTGISTVVCLGLLFWLFRSDNSYTVLLIIGAALQSTTAILYAFVGATRDTRCEDLMATRPELIFLNYLQNLPEAPKGSTEDKLYWATLDDFVYSFAVDKNARSNAPLETDEAMVLSEAQWRATHDEKPLAGEMVLLLYRDGTNHRIKVLVTKIKSVQDASPDALLNTPGTSVIKAASQKFSGGRIAHYCDTPNEVIERGWLATADRAHVLLTSLRWMEDHQRQFCYQLINPGKPYPTVSDWSQC